MKEFCLKYPGYTFLIIWVLFQGISNVTAALHGSKIEPVFYVGLCK